MALHDLGRHEESAAEIAALEQAVVRRLFGRIDGEIGIVDIPLNQPGALERAADPFGDPLHQALELLRTRRRNRHEHQATFTLTPINAVEHKQVEARLDGDSVLMLVRRSFADYVALWLLDAAAEYGVVIAD